MTVAVFDSSAFKLRYKEFSALTNELLQAYFDEACIYINNTDDSVIEDAALRLMILNMVTAHIAKLSDAPLVGRTASVHTSAGGVNVSVQYEPGTRAWFIQTQYGASAWNAMAPYRAAFFVAPE